MQRSILVSILCAFTLALPVKAQPLDSLNQLKDHGFPVYYSSGQEERARVTARRVKKALDFEQKLLGFKPVITLVILSVNDWNNYTAEPMVYGMPHYNEKNNRLIVAAEDNPFWKSFLPPLDQLPAELRKPFKETYTTKNGDLSAQAFFDLLAIHELGHAFHMQTSLRMQRRWMGELFTNILLHTYIAEKEPELLPALTLFPKMVVAGGSKGFKYTSLQDIHERYGEVARQYPRNYGWYQCRWHSAAAGIYDAAGKKVGRKLWDALRNTKEVLTDEQLISLLETSVDKSIADMIRYWDAAAR